MHVTNTTKGPLALNDTTLLLPGIPTPVHNWDQLKKNAVVAAWLKAGVLRESEAAPSPEGSKLLPADKEALVAELTALGVKFHPNTGVAKLQALLTEEQGKAATGALLDVLAVRHDRRDTLEQLNGLLAMVESSQPEDVAAAKALISAVIGASGLSAQKWVALPPEERDAQVEAFKAAHAEMGSAGAGDEPEA